METNLWTGRQTDSQTARHQYTKTDEQTDRQGIIILSVYRAPAYKPPMFLVAYYYAKSKLFALDVILTPDLEVQDFFFPMV